MREPQEAVILKSEGAKEFTRITFIPDLKRFQMDSLDDDLVALFKRRAYDVAVSTGCKVSLNGKPIPVRFVFWNFSKIIFSYVRSKI
jgi:DNA topoisomerase-2